MRSAQFGFLLTLLIVVLTRALIQPSFAADPPLLSVEAKIPLGAVKARIDHLAIDVTRRRLFVAELGNDSVGVVDLDTRTVMRRITSLREPQGLGYVASTDTLYVANAGDGSVRLFVGADFASGGLIDLGSDADNIRVNTTTNHVVIGYGSGGLAIIDTATHTKIGGVPLKAHPEGFQIDALGTRAFVNLPDAGAIAAIDLAARKVTAMIPLVATRSNFPMALDRNAFLIVSRSPPKLTAFGLGDNSLQTSVDTCGDADDVFVDAKRRRVYVSCGSGFLDIFDSDDAGYRKIGHMATATGARTSLFVPEFDRLFLAVRAQGSEAAAIWILQPSP